MSRDRYVKGNITKITHGNHNMYSKENIITRSMGRIFENGKQEGVVLGDPEEYIREGERVINIKSDLYIRNSQELQTPYLDISKILNYESSKPFIAGIRAIFGDDIKHTAAKKFMLDLLANNVPLPKWKAIPLSNYQGGFYNEKNKTIYINEKIILEAENDPEKSWLLFQIMIEEIGHYIDDLLRNKYDDIGGDAPGDEGTRFAIDFIHYNRLLFKEFTFAEFEIEDKIKQTRTFTGKVLKNIPNIEIKSKDLFYAEKKEDDHGIVILDNGEEVQVEFFKIRGGGAIHENITKQAAKAAGVIYDYRLDEGSAWPDVPCENQSSIETCYLKTWINLNKEGTLAYESHNGAKQYWHSMAPSGNYTNQQVKELILNQAEEWFKQGINPENNKKLSWFHSPIGNSYSGKKDGNDGLFFIGKILHMVQDSYSLSHVQRDANNQIVQFQGYDAQDPDKHAHPDKDGHSKGAQNALTASTQILNFYKEYREGKFTSEAGVLRALRYYLSNTVYPIVPNRENVNAGGSLPAYQK